MDLEAEIDRLYSLPLAEFVAERNALAKTLRAGGERERADEVKALAKPNVPAWVVNRLWHRERRAFDRLLDAGSAVRDAVAAGQGQRRAAERRREAARTLQGLARRHLAEAGHPATQTVVQKISHSLDAVVALGVDRLDPPLGRLIRDLEPPGFEFLSGLQLPSSPKRRTATAKRKSTTTSGSRRARPSPRAAGDGRRERRLRAARGALERSRGALATAEADAARLDRELEAARARAAETAEAAKKARESARLAAERQAEAKGAEKEAAKSARAARAEARRAAARVESATKRLTELADGPPAR